MDGTIPADFRKLRSVKFLIFCIGVPFLTSM